MLRDLPFILIIFF